MTSGLEDTIISYFDGGLSDADSAELLHRVSVSPEIRELFREHEMLRGLAHEATRSVMVRPEIEAQIFSRVEALAGSEQREKAMFVFSRRTAMALALALIYPGSLGYFVPKLFSGNPQAAIGSKRVMPQEISQAVSPVPSQASAPGNRSYKSYKNYRAYKTYEPPGSNPTNQNLEQPANNLSLLSSINPIASQRENISSNIGGEKHSPFDRIEYPAESRQLFDISLQTSSGFTIRQIKVRLNRSLSNGFLLPITLRKIIFWAFASLPAFTSSLPRFPARWLTARSI